MRLYEIEDDEIKYCSCGTAIGYREEICEDCKFNQIFKKKLDDWRDRQND